MKILMIGLGSIGQRHLRNIKRLMGEEADVIAYRTRRLKQTFSDNMQIRQGVDLEKEFGLRVYTELDEALKECPDVAFITNITAKHMEIALACARHGCSLFIEKPLSNTFFGVEQLEEIVRDNNLTVFMGFQNRYHPCIKEAKKILESDTIGPIQFVDAEFGERLTTMHLYEDYRYTYMAQKDMGGGPVLNLQIHDLDLLNYLFGKPVSVFSLVYKNSSLEIDVEDNAISTFIFNNKNGSLFASNSRTDFLQYPPSHKLKIVGEKGRIEIDMNQAKLQVFANGDMIINNVYSDFQRNDMFVDELNDFFDCFNNKVKEKIGLDQGIVSLKMALASKKSSDEKRMVLMEEIK